MLFGVVLIFLIQWLFLGDFRCALIVAGTIPVALLLAVIITVLRGESANLLSIGAIDLGIIVDASVIMVENIFRHLAHAAQRHPGEGDPGTSTKLQRILTAAVEVDSPIFFSVAITIAAFLPLFTMQGVEGQIFGPMSRTYAYALIGAVFATFTVTPVLSSFLLPANVTEIETFVVRHLRRVLYGDPAAGGAPCRPFGHHCRHLPGGVRRARHAARHRIPAQARRRQHVDSRG